MTRLPRPHRYAARARMPLMLTGLVLMLVSGQFSQARWPVFAGAALLAAGLGLAFLPLRGKPGDPVPVRSPVRGRWVPVNSPADRVPSHGTHEFGQTYAIDLVYMPAGDDWKPVHRWPPARRPAGFPGFGQPVYAVADGVVTQVCGWQRDHWSRNSWAVVWFLFLEGFARSVFSFLSGRFVLGNHVVLDLGGGVHAVFAHLRRGSVRVRKGDRIEAGQQLGECGNSGNSSEPHLHFQLSDSPRALIAAGIPFSFGYESEGRREYGVPGGRRPFEAGETAADDADADAADAGSRRLAG